MNTNIPAACLAIVATFFCVCCGDDVELIEKKNSQAAEITRLQGEIALIEEKLRTLPPDLSGELESKRKEIAAQEAEIKQLEAKIREQEERKNALQQEFSAYRAKDKIN